MRAVALALAFAFLTVGQSPEALLKQGIQLHQSGQFGPAIENYEQYLKLRPGSLIAESNLGAALAATGRYAEAVEHYRRALQVEPGNFPVRLNLALALYKQARLEEAIGELTSLHKAQPENRQVTLLLADCYLQVGANTKVIELLDPLDKAAPDDRAVSYLLGTALIRDNQVGRGQVIIDRILKHGEQAETLMLLGAAQMAAQENKKALATLARAIELNPKLPGLHSLYGQAKATDGDPEGAKRAFHAELEHNPSDYDANLQLGALYRVEKELDKAALYLRRAEKMRPHSVALKYQLGNLEMALGNLDNALSYLKQVVEEAPGFVEAHITIATLYYRMKRKEDGDRHRAIIEKLNQEQQKKELKKS
jgi:tetratricopeptide (TPR) repeat protein